MKNTVIKIKSKNDMIDLIAIKNKLLLVIYKSRTC